MELNEAAFVDPDKVPCPNGQLPIAAIRETDVKLRASADAMGPGTIHVPRFEEQILDYSRGRGALGQRVRRLPATGQPTRYFEQLAITDGEFADPRQIAPAPANHPRGHRAAVVKCIASGINFGQFDAEVTRDQSIYNELVADDIQRTIKGVYRKSDRGYWRGSDTNLVTPTTLEYMGGMKQINRTALVPSNSSAIDAIITEVASLCSNDDFEAKPSAIYAHPLTINIICQEERHNQRQVAVLTPNIQVTDKNGQAIAGLQVAGIVTAVGILPLIPDVSMPPPAASESESGLLDYKLAIVTEDLIEVRYVGSQVPRMYVLGLQANLATQYVCVLYDCIIFKGKADAVNQPETNPVSYAHSIVTVVR
jgi:hypothetical protein